MSWVIYSLIIGGLVGGGALLLLWKKMKGKEAREPNYYAFFISGICFLPVGIALMAAVSPGFIGITGLGICYIAIGLANKDKWPKNKR